MRQFEPTFFAMLLMIYLEQDGLPHAVLWVGTNKPGVKDKHYITIEPYEGNPFDLFFDSTQSIISPGWSRQTTLNLHL